MDVEEEKKIAVVDLKTRKLITKYEGMLLASLSNPVTEQYGVEKQ